MKIAICAICKNENLYLREWVEYHKNLGFDKIILYDNNAVDGEFPQQVIFDYVDSGYVDVHNVRGEIFKETPVFNFQVTIYNKCLDEHRDDFDWIAFIDIDEFIEIEEFKNIHSLFKKYNYNEYDSIILSWNNYGDDTLFYNAKESKVQDRFLNLIKNNNITRDGLDNTWTKSIVNTKTTKKMNSAHGLYRPKCCCAWGGQVWVPDYLNYTPNLQPIHNIMYIKHYPIKSFAEYLCRRIKHCSENLIKQRISSYSRLIGWSDQHQKMYDYMINYIDHTENIEKPVNKPKEGISIIISAYNAQEFIEECLDSIQNQTYFNDFNDYEILLGIDGCQTTLDKVQQIRHKYKNLRVFMMDENVGTYITCNTLIKKAKYNWINRFDADDIMLPYMIETIMSQTGDEPIIRYKLQNFSKENPNIEIARSEGSIVLYKLLFEKYGGYQPWRCSADTELLHRLEGIVKIKYIDEVLFKRRIHEHNLTVAKETNFNSKTRQDAFIYITTKSKDNPKIETITTNCKEI